MIAGPANQTGELRTRGVVLKRGCFPLAANAGGVRQDPATQMESELQLLLKRVTAKEGFIHTVERQTPGTGRCFVGLDIYVSFGGESSSCKF